MRAMRTGYDKSKMPLRGDLGIAVRLTRFDEVNKK